MRAANNFPGGLIFGLLLPMLALLLYFAFARTDEGLFQFLEETQRIRLLSPMLSLAALLNLAAFYFFLQKNWYKTVQGVITATLLYAFLILFLKFVL
jgi:hypothetical protein